MKKLVYRNGFGQTSVVTLTKEFREKHDGKTEDAVLDIVQAKHQANDPGASNFIRIQEAQVPTDRIFRNAWEIFGGGIRENLDDSRIIHQTNIDRIKDREMKLLADEIVVQQALGNDITGLQAQIQGIQTAVDNVGPNINAAGTPAILKAVWPVGLPTE